MTLDEFQAHWANVLAMEVYDKEYDFHPETVFMTMGQYLSGRWAGRSGLIVVIYPYDTAFLLDFDARRAVCVTHEVARTTVQMLWRGTTWPP